MGMHASGEVFYGLDLGQLVDDRFEEIGPSWVHDGETEWEEALAEARGIVRVDFPEHAWRADLGVRGELDKEHHDVIAYREWRDQVREVKDSSPVELETYGHCEGETSWCVQVKASVVRSTYDAVPLKLDVAPVTVVDWSAAVLGFCSELGLPVPEGIEPGWLLTSSYG